MLFVLFCIVVIVIISVKVSKKIKQDSIARKYFEFPQVDEYGNKALKIREIELSGYSHEHFGSNPQNKINRLSPGEQLLLEADPENEHDPFAVAVFTLSMSFIGWIPAGRNKTISQKLQNGETVYARFLRRGCEEHINYDRFYKENGKNAYASDDELLMYTDFYHTAIIEVQTYSSSSKKTKAKEKDL